MSKNTCTTDMKVHDDDDDDDDDDDGDNDDDNDDDYDRVPIYAQLCVFDAQKSQRTLAFSCQCVPGTHGSLFLL